MIDVDMAGVKRMNVQSLGAPFQLSRNDHSPLMA